MENIKVETSNSVDNTKRMQFTFSQDYSKKSPLTVELANHEIQEAIMDYLDSFPKYSTIKGVVMSDMNRV